MATQTTRCSLTFRFNPLRELYNAAGKVSIRIYVRFLLDIDSALIWGNL